MPSNPLATRMQEILSPADVQINGARPWDITVHNENFYTRVFRQGSIGMGESYMDGWWDCPRLDEFFHKVFASGADRRAAHSWRAVFLYLKSLVLNPQTKSRSTKVAEEHYDLGNDLFQYMLDARMVYTSGHWQHAADLNEAQEAKLDFVCRQLRIERGMRVLDIGCGWGGLAKFAAEKYGARVVGVTLSKEQLEFGKVLCAGSPVELRLQDYRDIHESFDRIVSLGMFEHVGSKNYRRYFDVARKALRDGGRMFLSTIGSNHSVRNTDPWIERYIFPNSHLPSIPQIGKATEDLFLVEDWRNWGADYDRTLMAWYGNFKAHWEKLRTRYSERFYRMWEFYLLACAASFRARRLQVWQILLSPAGATGEATTRPSGSGDTVVELGGASRQQSFDHAQVRARSARAGATGQ